MTTSIHQKNHNLRPHKNRFDAALYLVLLSNSYKTKLAWAFKGYITPKKHLKWHLVVFSSTNSIFSQLSLCTKTLLLTQSAFVCRPIKFHYFSISFEVFIWIHILSSLIEGLWYEWLKLKEEIYEIPKKIYKRLKGHYSSVIVCFTLETLEFQGMENGQT